MSTGTALLLRHARTAANAAGRYISRSNRPLDEIGREQAARAGAALAGLSTAAVVTSPSRRARQITEIVARKLEEDSPVGSTSAPGSWTFEGHREEGARAGTDGREFHAWRTIDNQQTPAGVESAADVVTRHEATTGRPRRLAAADGHAFPDGTHHDRRPDRPAGVALPPTEAGAGLLRGPALGPTRCAPVAANVSAPQVRDPQPPRATPNPRNEVGPVPEQTVILINPTGLHARPAKVFANAASETAADVTVTKGDREVNAESVLSVLTLDCHQGDEIVIRTAGEDADSALDKLVALVESGLGENEKDGSEGEVSS